MVVVVGLNFLQTWLFRPNSRITEATLKCVQGSAAVWCKLHHKLATQKRNCGNWVILADHSGLLGHCNPIACPLYAGRHNTHKSETTNGRE
jgi:hypothetical protein